jgi:hypothetical protein
VAAMMHPFFWDDAAVMQPYFWDGFFTGIFVTVVLLAGAWVVRELKQEARDRRKHGR